MGASSFRRYGEGKVGGLPACPDSSCVACVGKAVFRSTATVRRDCMTRTSHGQPTSPAEQIAALEQQLAEAQKMTALGELVSTTTHEFNNVLMTILNYAKMGLRSTDEPTRTKALEKILAAGQRAAKITNSVLGVARNRTAGFEATDLATLVEDALVLLDREMRKYRIDIERQFEPAPSALANGNQIQQVLLNLLINARQAMPEGGRIIIRI